MARVRVELFKIETSRILGDAVKVLAILDTIAPDTYLITIDDPCNNEKVDGAVMTKDADGVFSYVWQSATTDDEGEYWVTLKFKIGDYTTMAQKSFTMGDPEGE